MNDQIEQFTITYSFMSELQHIVQWDSHIKIDDIYYIKNHNIFITSRNWLILQNHFPKFKEVMSISTVIGNDKIKCYKAQKVAQTNNEKNNRWLL